MLLLDEPFGALDAKVRVELRRWLRQIHDDTGYTTVFVTHDQEEALELADRVVVLNEGRIEQIGTPDEVYADPRTPFVFDFLGRSNRLQGEVRDGRFLPDGDGRRDRVAGGVRADAPAVARSCSCDRTTCAWSSPATACRHACGRCAGSPAARRWNWSSTASHARSNSTWSMARLPSCRRSARSSGFCRPAIASSPRPEGRANRAVANGLLDCAPVVSRRS